jgi:hypothetical protein
MDVPSKSRRGLCVALIVGALIVSAACLVYPFYVIRPFRFQGARELAVALRLMQVRGLLTVIALFIAIAAAARYWMERPPVWKRVMAIVAAVGVCLAAVLCRVNVYELMFHPNSRPHFSAARAAKLDGDEKVIAVRMRSSSRAYPIRDIAYHHVINDVVDGVPIVATY